MKNIKVLLLIAIAALLFSCDIKDPVDGLEVRLNSIQRETLVTGYVYDAKTGSSIEQNVSITFSGTNAGQMIDETNFSKTSFTAKNGFFNFGIKDGAVVSENAPLKVLVTLQTPGYLDVTTPVSFTEKGVQAVTFFMAKKEDFQESIIENNNISVANADNSGTVTTDTETTTADGITISIPAGAAFKTSTGTPLNGNLIVDIKTISFNSSSGTLPLLPRSLGTSDNGVITPFLSFSFDIHDQSGKQASTIDNITFSFTLPGDIADSSGKSFRSGNEIRQWKTTNGPFDNWMLDPFGNFAHVNLFGNLFTQFTFNPLTLTSLISLQFVNFNFGNFSFLNNGFNIHFGPYSITCENPETINIENPEEGYNLQVFRTDAGESAVLEETFPNIPANISLGRNNYSPSSTYEFKSGANPATGGGGISFGTISVPEGCGSDASMTFNYPAESIQAIINVNGVCTSRDPVVRVYPSITFNYRVKGSGTWQQGSASNGQVVIAGLTPNTVYEAKTTYRDKEASVEINVVSATNFQISAGSNQGALLRADVTGTSTVDGESVVNLEIDIDLKNDCD